MTCAAFFYVLKRLTAKLLLILGSLFVASLGQAQLALLGQDLFVKREGGHCILCHQVSAIEDSKYGNIGPNLAGIAKRRSKETLRQIIVDARVYFPNTVMPPYGIADAGARPSAHYRGKAVLTPDEIEKLLEYLFTLP